MKVNDIVKVRISHKRSLYGYITEISETMMRVTIMWYRGSTSSWAVRIHEIRRDITLMATEEDVKEAQMTAMEFITLKYELDGITLPLWKEVM